jgi:hypothetical protein
MPSHSTRVGLVVRQLSPGSGEGQRLSAEIGIEGEESGQSPGSLPDALDPLGSAVVLEAQICGSHDPSRGLCPERALYAGLTLCTGSQPAFLFASAKNRSMSNARLCIDEAGNRHVRAMAIEARLVLAPSSAGERVESVVQEALRSRQQPDAPNRHCRVGAQTPGRAVALPRDRSSSGGCSHVSVTLE